MGNTRWGEVFKSGVVQSEMRGLRGDVIFVLEHMDGAGNLLGRRKE